MAKAKRSPRRSSRSKSSAPRARVAPLTPEQRYLKDYARAKEQLELRERVQELRRYLFGFESADGFDLRSIDSWSKAKREKVRGTSYNLRGVIGQPHVTLDRSRLSRSSAKRKAQLRSIRDLSGLNPKNLKKFVFITDKPERTTIEFSKKGTLRIYQRFGKAVSEKEFYFYRDYVGYQPVTFEQQRKALKKMLPKMPEGYYQLWTFVNGPIGRRQPKESLGAYLQQYHLAYEPPNPDWTRHRDFAEVVVGFVRTGDDNERGQEKAQAFEERFRSHRARRSARNQVFAKQRYRTVKKKVAVRLANVTAKKKSKKKAKKKTIRRRRK